MEPHTERCLVYTCNVNSTSVKVMMIIFTSMTDEVVRVGRSRNKHKPVSPVVLKLKSVSFFIYILIKYTNGKL